MRNGTDVHARFQPMGFGSESLGFSAEAVIGYQNFQGCNDWQWNGNTHPHPRGEWVAVIARGSCDFSVKAENAVKAGASGVIMFAVDDSDVFQHVYCPSNDDAVGVPLLMLPKNDGYTLVSSTGNMRSLVTISAFQPLDKYCVEPSIRPEYSLIWQGAVFFIIVFICALCFFNRIRTLRTIWALERRQNVASEELANSFLSDEDVELLDTNVYELIPDAEQQTCIICLDDFGAGDVQSVLPCRHSYHPACIKKWLTSHSSECPLCKQDVKKSMGISNVPVGVSEVPLESASVSPADEGADSPDVISTPLLPISAPISAPLLPNEHVV